MTSVADSSAQTHPGSSGVVSEAPKGQWVGAQLTPYRVGEPGRSTLEVIPRLAGEPVGRPDTIVDGAVIGCLEVRAASVRGLKARQSAVTRQDEYCLAAGPGDEWLVVAVADGVSSGRLSHYAATIAARHGCHELVRHLGASTPDKVDWPALIANVSDVIYQEGLRRLPTPPDQHDRARYVAGVMATTVCYAIIGTQSSDDSAFPAYLFCIGDTSAWVRDGGGWSCRAGGKALDQPVTSSAVVALPSEFSQMPQPVLTRLGTRAPLLVLSDGVGDPMGDGTGSVGTFLAEVFKEPPDALTFAAQLAFARKSFLDDRTGVAVWPRVA